MKNSHRNGLYHGRGHSGLVKASSSLSVVGGPGDRWSGLYQGDGVLIKFADGDWPPFGIVTISVDRDTPRRAARVSGWRLATLTSHGSTVDKSSFCRDKPRQTRIENVVTICSLIVWEWLDWCWLTVSQIDAADPLRKTTCCLATN